MDAFLNHHPQKPGETETLWINIHAETDPEEVKEALNNHNEGSLYLNITAKTPQEIKTLNKIINTYLKEIKK